MKKIILSTESKEQKKNLVVPLTNKIALHIISNKCVWTEIVTDQLSSDTVFF